MEGIFRVRFSVLENRLADPSAVTPAMCEEMLLEKGGGWVCEAEGQVVGFAMVDLTNSCVWALFVDPLYEKKGIGKKLHDLMVDWSFAQGQSKLWLTTDPGTRAETFYRKAGWVETGKAKNGELRFELDRS
ncbi:acetyltransferase (GNAT) family protein [Pontibacter ummariensis]|uniref:Acetyltransferase (GNAT) family protein n=2 Tax=Pontibacter ummariensis TaxID=1610492 RepID=A0A239B174_9BACT|nr:acetyltransferase (GNAT) family protein [Pontibacter ummariensis]SNS01617.1 Acetyltransferase (GNAT) family protein [Pontibacter ummariensis]